MRLLILVFGLICFLTLDIARTHSSITAGDDRLCPLLTIWRENERDRILSYLEGNGHPLKAQFVKLQWEFCQKRSFVVAYALRDAEQAYRDNYYNAKVMPYDFYALFSELNRLSKKEFSRSVDEEMPNGITYEYASISPICEFGVSLNEKEFQFMLNTMLTPENDPFLALIRARLTWCVTPNAATEEKAEEAWQTFFKAAQDPNLTSETDLINNVREIVPMVKEQYRAETELAKQQAEPALLGSSFAKGTVEDNEICNWMRNATREEFDKYIDDLESSIRVLLKEYIEMRLKWCINPTDEFDDRATGLWRRFVRDESKLESVLELERFVQ